MRKLKQYALYQNDEPLYTGSKKELAEYLNVKIETIEFYMSPTCFKRYKGGYKVYPIDYEGDDVYDKSSLSR